MDTSSIPTPTTTTNNNNNNNNPIKEESSSTTTAPPPPSAPAPAPVVELTEQEKKDREADRQLMIRVLDAITQLLNERQVYTEEMVQIVIQRLFDQSPLPRLLLRTMIVAVTMYPKLTTFILNKLSHLIHKKVYEDRSLWEGWIKCVEKLSPASLNNIFALPDNIFMSVINNNNYSALKQKIIQYANEHPGIVKRPQYIALFGAPPPTAPTPAPIPNNNNSNNNNNNNNNNTASMSMIGNRGGYSGPGMGMMNGGGGMTMGPMPMQGIGGMGGMPAAAFMNFQAMMQQQQQLSRMQQQQQSNH